MEFGELSDHARYGIVFAAIAAVALVIGQAIVVMRFDDMLLFLVPLFVVVLGGVVWDRIYLHDEAI